MIDLYQFDWNSQKVLSRNRLAPRTHFYPYPDESSAKAQKDSVRVESLNGNWNFRWFSSPLEVTDTILQQEEDPQSKSIPVPMNWQYAGYGKRCYTDLLYPFPVDPPHIPAMNETGIYRRTFQVSSSGNHRTMLRFEGVESAFHVYVNGLKAGYSQGSRLPSEFDITGLVHDGENRLVLEVYQYSDGTYLEDQDMWWLGGITRDVLLITRPQCYLKDLVLDPDYDVTSSEGILRPVMPLSEESGSVTLEVFDGEGKQMEVICSGKEVRVPGVSPWTAETPSLYTVIAIVRDASGAVTEAIPQKIGFRHIAIEDGILKINGSPIFMRGVNRHEYNPKTGRAITRELAEKELKMIKEAGFNAIRCSHYPNNPFFYDICDYLGLYVIDECDLETHGFEPLGKDTQLNSDPQWQEAYLDRVQRMVGRDRNRACVVIWSLGNESAYGPNFRAMYDWCKENEPSRPVHYEGDFKNQSVDVSSTMYSTIGELKELDIQASPVRPHILCECAHAMGNGPGSLKDYFEACEHSRRIQGMFVWEFKDHGVWEKRPDGTELYRFGGEYGEKFHNGNFCMDGLVRSDGVPSPGFYEYSRVAEPVHVESVDLACGIFTVRNRFDFLDLSAFSCSAVIRCDGRIVNEYQIDLPTTAPRQTSQVLLPKNLTEGCEEGALVTMELRFTSVRPVCGQEESGWLVGTKTVVIREEAAAPVEISGPARCEADGLLLKVSGKNFSFRLNPAMGRLEHYCVNGVTLMEEGPLLNYNRPYTDNDAINQKEWDKLHIHSMQMSVSVLDWKTEDQDLIITVKGKFSPCGRDWGTDVTVVYRVLENGTICVSFAGNFYGPLPSELPKIGTVSHIAPQLKHVVWRGFGPGECYNDSCQAQADGIWEEDATNMGFAYSCPQENANRTGVHWAAFVSDSGDGMAVASSRPIDMAVRCFSDDVIQKTAHSCDLTEDSDKLYLHLDYRNSGLGSGSCGPAALAQYKVYPLPYLWEMAFVPLHSGESCCAAARRAMAYL